MALFNLSGWSKKDEPASACGAGDKPSEAPAACGAADEPAEKPTACGHCLRRRRQIILSVPPSHPSACPMDPDYSSAASDFR